MINSEHERKICEYRQGNADAVSCGHEGMAARGSFSPFCNRGDRANRGEGV